METKELIEWVVCLSSIPMYKNVKDMKIIGEIIERLEEGDDLERLLDEIMRMITRFKEQGLLNSVKR